MATAPGVDRHHRSPGASRLPRPTVSAARPGVRARSHVHVAVLHLRVDSAPGRHDRLADVDPPRTDAACCFCVADRAHVDVAAGRRARRPGTRRLVAPACPSPVHHGDDRHAWQGSPRHRYRPTPHHRTACGMGEVVRSGIRSALGVGAWHTLAWAIFGGAYVGAVIFVSTGPGAGPGNVLLVLAAGSRLSATSGRRLEKSGFFAASGWTARAGSPGSRITPPRWWRRRICPRPPRLVDGIRFEHVSFAYPGTERLVLDDVNLELPAGAVVAIVGENGAGKTTLVKLLAQVLRADRRPDHDRRHATRANAAPTTGASGWPARSRIFSASSSAPGTPSASATCRAWTTSLPS